MRTLDKSNFNEETESVKTEKDLTLAQFALLLYSFQLFRILFLLNSYSINFAVPDLVVELSKNAGVTMYTCNY